MDQTEVGEILMGWKYVEAMKLNDALTGPARATLAALCYSADDDTGIVTASFETLEKMSGRSRPSTKRDMREIGSLVKVVRKQTRLPDGTWSEVVRKLTFPPIKGRRTGGHSEPRHRGSNGRSTGGHHDPLTLRTRAADPDGSLPVTKNIDRGL